MVDSFQNEIAQMSVREAFLTLEKKVAGYNDYIDCTPESFEKTL